MNVSENVVTPATACRIIRDHGHAAMIADDAVSGDSGDGFEPVARIIGDDVSLTLVLHWLGY